MFISVWVAAGNVCHAHVAALKNSFHQPRTPLFFSLTVLGELQPTKV
jgi:hypothetical protein